MTPPSPTLLGALRLRRWALGLLAGTPVSPPDHEERSWRLFLAREACASRLRLAAGTLAPTPLRSAADTDTQHILLLRAELADLLAVADRAGVRPVILKGGAALHSPARAVNAKDIDLLLDPGGARRLVTALDAAGWQTHGGGTGHHYAERFRPGRPPVEIHTSDRGDAVGLGAAAEQGAIDHPTLPGARLLAPADRIRQLAIHQTIQHTAYRGRLRDLLLLGDALDEGTPPVPEEWGLPSRVLPAVRLVLGMARSLRARERPADPFEELAALWYTLDLAAGDRPAGSFRSSLAGWVFDFAAADGAAAHHWAVSWGPRVEDRTWLGSLRRLETRAPRLLRLLRTGMRMLWLPPTVVWAWIIMRRESKTARVAITSLG